MSRRDSIDSKTAGETILSAAVNAAMSVPHGQSIHACVALASVNRRLNELMFQPQHNCMVRSASAVGEWAEHQAGKTPDEYAQNVYIAVYQAAYDFAETLDYNLNMEATTLPF